MNNQLIAITVFFLVMNLLAFVVMLIDKHKSRKENVPRISEGMLFFLATAFGSLGVYAGMFAFRHKTRKWHFVLGIPLLLIQNVALLYLVYNYLIENSF